MDISYKCLFECQILLEAQLLYVNQSETWNVLDRRCNEAHKCYSLLIYICVKILKIITGK